MQTWIRARNREQAAKKFFAQSMYREFYIYDITKTHPDGTPPEKRNYRITAQRNLPKSKQSAYNKYKRSFA